ncbi:MAG: glycine cleavage system protein GcvH [Proteobacteria bacterium]|nr:glycine cleavage system protein GcvH [Pseudomonadota bacterium]
MTKRYTKDHEWVELNGDVATIGISSYATEQLGEVVYVELPAKDKDFAAHADMAVVESAKAASDVYAPIAGKIVDANAALADNPGLVNEAPEGAGWFVKIKVANKAEVDALMDEAAYADYVKGL